MPRILVADDDADAREPIAAILKKESVLSVVFATDGTEAMAEFERNLLEQTLREAGGRKGDAAALLSIPRKRLYLRLKAVGLLKPGQD